MSAISQWSKLVTRMTQLAGNVLNLAPQATRLYLANDLAGLIQNTGAGLEVGDSGMSKENMQGLQEVWAAFEVWSNTPLASGIPPVIMLSKIWDAPVVPPVVVSDPTPVP